MKQGIFALLISIVLSFSQAFALEQLTEQQEAVQIVNINKATAEQIADSLQGVGEKKAKAIVDFRNENGPFKDVSELSLVSGIGQKTLEKNAALIILN